MMLEMVGYFDVLEVEEVIMLYWEGNIVYFKIMKR